MKGGGKEDGMPAASSAEGAAGAGEVPLMAPETAALNAAVRANRLAAEKLAAATAKVTAPLDPFQLMMQSSIASLNTAMAVLQATLAEAREKNLTLENEVFKLKESAAAADGDGGWRQEQGQGQGAEAP